MLSRALDTHADLRKPKDKEWIQILLSFLNSYVDGVGMRLLTHEDEKVTYVSSLVEELKSAAQGLKSGELSFLPGRVFNSPGIL